MEINVLANAFLALGQDLRLTIYRQVVQAWPMGIRPNELKQLLNIPQATLSFHLKHLLLAGFIDVEKEGTSFYYFAKKKMVTDVIDELLTIEKKFDSLAKDVIAKPRIKAKM
jgi:hypothetical protein